MSINSSRPAVLSLYKTMLREAQKFSDFNFRWEKFNFYLTILFISFMLYLSWSSARKKYFKQVNTSQVHFHEIFICL
jgi:hypothetical protein